MADITIDDRLKDILRHARDDTKPEELEEFAFHFRDCRDELERLADVLKHPSRFTDTEIREAVDGALLHAVGHLVQAARMYHGFIDPFGTSSSESET